MRRTVAGAPAPPEARRMPSAAAPMPMKLSQSESVQCSVVGKDHAWPSGMRQ